jgi:4-amino-4-deoxy-L-arabinose transferase-like glycosyltransferase
MHPPSSARGAVAPPQGPDVLPGELARDATTDRHGEAGVAGRTVLTTTPPRHPRVKWEPDLLPAILLGALALRIYGLRWALPERTDLNPDESTVLTIVGQMSWRNLDPGAYFYGGFFYQACILVRSILRVLWPGIGDAGLVLAYRSVSVLFGTATVALLYLLLRRVAPAGPAPLLGAAFLAVMPLHVWDSHFAVTDVTLTFWMMASVTAAVWAYQHPSWARFVLASALAGLATGTKFNGAFATVAITLAALAAIWERRVRVGQVFACGALGVAAALLAMFIASPHVFLKWRATWRAFQHEMSRVHDLDYGFNLWAHGWQYKPYVYQFGAAFPFSFGVALYAALLGGLIYCAVRWRRVLIVPFGYAAFYLGVMGSWEFVPIRYYLPFEPVLLMAPALALAAGFTAPAVRLRRWTGVGLALVLGYTVAFTVSTTARFTDDTRLQAQRWLQSRVEEGHDVLTVGAEWYLPTPKGPRVANLLQYLAMPAVVADSRPDYVVLTSLHYARSYRERDGNVAMWNMLRKGVLPYRLAQRFRAEYLNGWFYRRLDPMYEGYFISPTIEVYQRLD